MTQPQGVSDTYLGFEQGPIRPPSEAASFLVRVTRNCPWNKCTFCPVYKEDEFSIRPIEDIKKDIDVVADYLEILQEAATRSDQIHISEIHAKIQEHGEDFIDWNAFDSALRIFHGNGKSAFIQDANSLIVKPDALVEVIMHLKQRLPAIKRITSYARSHTISRIKEEKLVAIRKAGLNRIHIGLESGSDEVLKRVRKGATKEMHIIAGCKVKEAGMELSEYVMPGLGGVELSEEHAIETADTLNQINPDFIRFRTLAIPENVPLFDEYQVGHFKKCSERMVVQEILLLLENLKGITSVVKSDHILNLFGELEGVLPQDQEYMVGLLRKYLSLDTEGQCLFQLGRRLGVFRQFEDMEHPHKREKVQAMQKEFGITPENIEQQIDELTKRFI